MHTHTPTRTAEAPLSWCGTDRDLYRRGEQIIRPGRMSMPMVVVSGAMRLDLPGEDDSAITLALPGDLLGVEVLLGQLPRSRGVALVATEVALLGPVPQDQWLALLGRQLLSARQRQMHLARLRHGAAADRVETLLGLLEGVQLPRLTDIAALTDLAPETVSRHLSGRRRALQDLPSGQVPGRVAVSPPSAACRGASGRAPATRTAP
ncbi:cAMP-binding domain of CRP or a regulatory subunit of cAMP-dependent protein kinases [Sphaerotilus natans]|nr:cAMP-binding domain of CRP or a regulatory subunit of cAMP-dependent protein kinases [Sphaerotilus natans]